MSDDPPRSPTEYEAHTYADIGMPSPRTPLEDRYLSPDDDSLGDDPQQEYDNRPCCGRIVAPCPAPNATRRIGVLSLDDTRTAFFNNEVLSDCGDGEYSSEWTVERKRVKYISVRDATDKRFESKKNKKLVEVRFHPGVQCGNHVLPSANMIFSIPNNWTKRMLLMLIQLSTEKEQVISCVTCTCMSDMNKHLSGDINHILSDYAWNSKYMLEEQGLQQHFVLYNDTNNISGGLK